VGSRYDVDGRDWYPGLVEFLKGVDLCVHDAMFTDDEYPGVEGWGHSTYSQAVQLAEDAGVTQLLFFHHAPERSDDHLLRILDEARAGVERRGTNLELAAAEEGVELLVSSAGGGGEPAAA
jgi:ribonuclease BN (tRNA processing enzyme)